MSESKDIVNDLKSSVKEILTEAGIKDPNDDIVDTLSEALKKFAFKIGKSAIDLSKKEERVTVNKSDILSSLIKVEEDEKSRREGTIDLMKDFHIALISTAGLLIAISIGAYAYTMNLPTFPNQFIVYSSIAYLFSIISGIFANGALISAIYYSQDFFKSLWVRIPGILQWLFFLIGSAIEIVLLYILISPT